MKRRFFGLLVFLTLFETLASATHMNDLELKIVEISSQGSFTVEMINVSEHPIKIWKESNSWGAARWRAVLIRKGQIESFFANPDRDFTRNGPIFDEIAPGKSKTYTLDLNDSNWCGLGHCLSYGQHRSDNEQIRFKPGDEIIVSYDVPFTPESLRLDVWYGVAVAIKTIQ